MIRDIRRSIHSMNEAAQPNKSQPKKLTILFTEYIQTHAAIKQLGISQY